LIGAVSAGSFQWGVQENPDKHGTGWCVGAESHTQWADMNGDGQQDMICDWRGKHWVKFSYGNGNYYNRGMYSTGWCGHAGSYVQYADINGDGKDDLICDDHNGTHWVQLSLGGGNLKNLGVVARGWCSHAGSWTKWADVNGDGKADMICDDNTGRHWFKLSNGNGTFQDLGLKLSGWCGHAGAYTQWADVNGDGKADIHCDDSAGRHWVGLSNGNGTFRQLGIVRSGWCSHAGSKTSWADINGDGKADMLCDDNKGNHWALVQTGYGNTFQDLGLFQRGWCVSVAGNPAQTLWADVDGDGNADLTCSTQKGSHWVKYSHWIN